MAEARGRAGGSLSGRTAALGLAVLAAAAAAVSPANAAPSGQRSAALPFHASTSVRTLDVRDGLSHNVTLAVLQDRVGFIWIGTIDGLNRFDGRRFEIFRHDPDDPTSLSNSTVRKLWEGPGGEIWIRTAAGLDRFDRGTRRFVRYPLEGQQLVFGTEGAPLVAAPDGLHRYDPAADRFRLSVPFPLDASLSSPSEIDHVWGMLEDATGNVWVATERGRIFRVAADGTVSTWTAPWRQVILLRQDASGGFWVGHAEGVGRFDPAPGVFAELSGAEAVTGVLSHHTDADGVLWVGGVDLYRLDGQGRATQVGLGSDEHLARPVWGLARDRDGAVWVATPHGLRIVDPWAKPFRSLRRDPASESSLSSNSVISLAADPSGGLWAGTLGAGLNRVEANGVVRRFPAGAADGALCGARVWAVLARPDGRLWVGTDAGLCVHDPDQDRFERVRLATGAGATPPMVFTLLDDRAGGIWAGTATGLYRIDERSGSAGRVDRLERDRGGRVGVEGLMRDSHDNLWVGTSRSDLYRIEPSGAVRWFPLGDDQRLRGSEGFWALVERPDGRLWLGSDRGLFSFDPQRGVLELGGRSLLPAMAVYSILPVGSGAWLGTNGGLVRLETGESGASGGLLARQYTTADGLPHPEFNRRAALALADGRLVFGGMGGVTFFHPHDIRDNPNPPLVAIDEIERFRRDGSVLVNAHGRSSLTLAHDDTGVRIRFAALTYGGVERTQHAYRLEGFDPEWVRVGANREVRYPALAPGTYRFWVRGANADGVWNHEGATIELRVPPPWWRTAWFQGGAGLALLTLLVAGVHQVSTRTLRRRVADLETDRRLRLERERISRDLHDNVGAQVSTILTGLELARLEARAPGVGKVVAALESLEEDARATMVQLRETVWSLHRDDVSVADLFDQIQEHLHERQRHAPAVELDAFGGGDLTVRLRAADALQLFRVVQEALSNALRHANASRVQVRLIVHAGRTLLLEVADDGTFRAPTERPHGFGLEAMRARARELGGELLVDPGDDGSGTTVSLRVSLP